MITPPKGDYASVPLNALGRQVADGWDLVADGKGSTLGEVQAAGLTRDYDGRYGAAAGPAAPSEFIATIYRSLAAEPR
jgi:hypothetical protein